jgi:hypothetical protein
VNFDKKEKKYNVDYSYPTYQLVASQEIDYQKGMCMILKFLEAGKS